MSDGKYIIAPSILASNFATLGEEVVNVLGAGADWSIVATVNTHTH